MERYPENEKFSIDDEITLNLKEWFRFLFNKFYILLLAAAAGAVLALLITKVFITPMYISETKVYVMARQSSETTVTFSDLELSSQLSADYRQFALSRPVLEATAEQLDFDISAGALMQAISIDTAADARILNISVESDDPEHAQAIADVFREASNERFTEIVGIDSVTTIEEASLPASASSPNLAVNLIIGIVIAVLLICIILTFLYIRDDSLKTPDDVEHYLGLNVLASIPILEKGYGADAASYKAARRSSRKRSYL